VGYVEMPEFREKIHTGKTGGWNQAKETAEERSAMMRIGLMRWSSERASGR
jgi:hypothetical protein